MQYIFKKILFAALFLTVQLGCPGSEQSKKQRSLKLNVSAPSLVSSGGNPRTPLSQATEEIPEGIKDKESEKPEELKEEKPESDEKPSDQDLPEESEKIAVNEEEIEGKEGLNTQQTEGNVQKKEILQQYGQLLTEDEKKEVESKFGTLLEKWEECVKYYKNLETTMSQYKEDVKKFVLSYNLEQCTGKLKNLPKEKQDLVRLMCRANDLIDRIEYAKVRTFFDQKVKCYANQIDTLKQRKNNLKTEADFRYFRAQTNSLEQNIRTLKFDLQRNESLDHLVDDLAACIKDINNKINNKNKKNGCGFFKKSR
ncbi:hypothetical protein [Cardinium endosymbiont of Philonthus spinipes]|uniref:hypothetical protein n=1 Tax=Cardinium endosymbiont of Philonthus spinipes TaxID=3077941 RepID=UPI00313D4CF4